MKSISFKTPSGQIDLEISDALIRKIAASHSIPEDAVSDSLILSFFREASDTAFKRAETEYLESDGS